jgi:hypothetical protein
MSNHSDTYTYPPTGEQFARVTTILSATDGKQRYLVPWAARLAAEYAVDNLAVLAETVRAGGEGGWQDAVDLAKKQSEEIRDRKRDVGTYVHDVVEALILWAASPDGTGTDIPLPILPEHLVGADYDDEPLEDVVDWMIRGFLNFTADFRPMFQASEMTVFNPALKVAGTLDMIVTLPGLAVGHAGRFIPGGEVTPCIDVKTGKYLDVTVPEQIACYRRMREALLPMGDLVPMPATECGAVLHLRPEHERGYRLMLISGTDDAAAWNRFRRAAELFHGRAAAHAKPGKVCYPLRADGTIPQPHLADLDGEGYGRALSALINAGVSDLEQVAAMTDGQCLAIKGVGKKVLGTIRVMLADHGLHLAGEAPELAKAA